MEIKTTFNCGDKAWVFNDAPERLTIGQIKVEFTDSPGIGETIFDNYKPKKGMTEKYMCVESGIGSGRVYTLGEHIFATEAECIAANAERIAERAAADARQQRERREQLLRQEAGLRAELAEIEAIKAAPAEVSP